MVAQQKETIKDNREFEYEVTCKRKDSVVGRLNKKFLFWKNELQASEFILNTIKNGYTIPFVYNPSPFFAKNNNSSLKHTWFVEEAIQSLLEKGCISETEQMPTCCNPLTVATKNSKLRLVLDLRHVNQCVNLQKFKYEDLKTFSELFEQDDYFITFDLTSGYHHVDINPIQRKYLGFYWKFNNVVRYFVFNVLPFGLNSACFIFTKLLRPFIKKWRAEGIKTILFIDDGILWWRLYNTQKISETEF